MIPKRIYFFWDGRPMPWLRFLALKSFKKFNQDWIIELWCPKHFTDKRITDLGIPIKKWISPKIYKGLILNGAQQSDIFQWYKLYETGGYYSDMDILYIKSINRLYRKSKNTDMLICCGKYLAIAFMGFAQHSIVLKNIINELLASYKQYTDNYQNVGNSAFYRSLGLTRGEHLSFIKAFEQKYPTLPYYNFKKKSFYNR